MAMLALVLRTRVLRQHSGNMPVRVLRPGKTRWMRGHAPSVSEVVTWRGSPAAWKGELAPIGALTVRDTDPVEKSTPLPWSA
jgi:hypothetical protein